jgi:hypothetical protein
MLLNATVRDDSTSSRTRLVAPSRPFVSDVRRFALSMSATVPRTPTVRRTMAIRTSTSE